VPSREAAIEWQASSWSAMPPTGGFGMPDEL
jgi:hypothetical protein